VMPAVTIEQDLILNNKWNCKYRAKKNNPLWRAKKCSQSIAKHSAGIRFECISCCWFWRKSCFDLVEECDSRL
jgi:hypothetical protein